LSSPLPTLAKPEDLDNARFDSDSEQALFAPPIFLDSDCRIPDPNFFKAFFKALVLSEINSCEITTP
jgi:hypothetical protein